MKKYKVCVEETLQRLIEVEATTPEEAESKVQQMYDSEEVVLDYSDYVSTEIYETEEVDDA